MPAHRLTSDEARKLSKLGARKGGRARANVLTPQERRESARKAAEARWDRVRAAKAAIASKSEVVLVDPKLDKPIALFSGKLRIAARSLACHVLNDWKRVIPQDDVVRSLAGHFEGSLDRFLETGDLKPFVHNLKVADRRVNFLIRPQSAGERKQRSTRHGISDDLSLNWWTSNRTTQAVIRQSLISATGYEATLLLDICEAYLKLREQAASASSHWSLARQAELITRACAKVGILGLIDEATGFDAFRQKQEYQIRLQAFIADDLQEWARIFPGEFWYELARLEEVHYSARARPLRWGKYVMIFVSDAIEKELGKKSDSGDLHISTEKVQAHIWGVVRAMKQCEDMADFQKKFDRVFNKSLLQKSLIQKSVLQAEKGVESALAFSAVKGGPLRGSLLAVFLTPLVDLEGFEPGRLVDSK